MAVFTATGKFGNVPNSTKSVYLEIIEMLKEKNKDWGKTHLPAWIYDTFSPTNVWQKIMGTYKKEEGEKVDEKEAPKPPKPEEEGKKEGGSPFYKASWNAVFPDYKTNWTINKNVVMSYATELLANDMRKEGFYVQYMPLNEIQRFASDYTIDGWEHEDEIYYSTFDGLIHEKAIKTLKNEYPEKTHMELHPLAFKLQKRIKDAYISKAIKELRI